MSVCAQTLRPMQKQGGKILSSVKMHTRVTSTYLRNISMCLTRGLSFLGGRSIRPRISGSFTAKHNEKKQCRKILYDYLLSHVR